MRNLTSQCIDLVLKKLTFARSLKFVGSRCLDPTYDFAGEFVRFVWGCDEMEISSQKLYAWWD
ncbi:MAG TPA: hypothetical protein DCE56_31310 [Cyanobacteria bacterium UBA8553]|nr:hypothetical protein [Cyanobacteria bacterium UBA8553]